MPRRRATVRHATEAEQAIHGMVIFICIIVMVSALMLCVGFYLGEKYNDRKEAIYLGQPGR